MWDSHRRDALYYISLLYYETYVCYKLECVSGSLPGMDGKRQINSFWMGEGWDKDWDW